MTGLSSRRAGGGLPDPEQNEPLDEAAYRHHWALLKSMHCARPVLYRGLNQFISGLTITGTGTQPDMVVYLAGIRGGIDSSEIQIRPTLAEGGEA
jgi:hypothetical protein